MPQSSTRIGLWRLGGLSFKELAARLWRGYNDHQISALAAQFAFHAMLALAPTLILLIAGLSRLPMKGLLRWLKQAMGNALPESSYQVLHAQIQDLYKNANSSLTLACVGVLLFAGWRLFHSLGQGLNAVNGLRTTAHPLRTGGISFILTLAIVPTMMLALALTVAGPMLTRMALKALEWPMPQRYVMHGFRWAIVVACLLLATSALYRLLPAAKVRWEWVSPGNLFAVSGWLISGWGFRVYVENFGRYNETYGTLGGVIVLQLWLYLIGTFLLLGGLINGVIYRAVEEAGAGATNTD